MHYHHTVNVYWIQKIIAHSQTLKRTGVSNNSIRKAMTSDHVAVGRLTHFSGRAPFFRANPTKYNTSFWIGQVKKSNFCLLLFSVVIRNTGNPLSPISQFREIYKKEWREFRLKGLDLCQFVQLPHLSMGALIPIHHYGQILLHMCTLPTHS